MAHDIDFIIHGDDMQAVQIELDPAEAVRAMNNEIYIVCHMSF